MGLECSTRTIAENASGRDGQDISMRSRTFEATDPHTLDFSEAVGGRTDCTLVEGCLIKGGGAAKVTWGYDICMTDNGIIPIGYVLFLLYGATNQFTDKLATAGIGDAAVELHCAGGNIVTVHTFDLAVTMPPPSGRSTA